VSAVFNFLRTDIDVGPMHWQRYAFVVGMLSGAWFFLLPLSSVRDYVAKVYCNIESWDTVNVLVGWVKIRVFIPSEVDHDE